MIFLMDTATQKIMAFNKWGIASRHALNLLNVELEQNADPVKAFNSLDNDRVTILNLSSMFLSIAESDNELAQELAKKCQLAVDKLYEK